MSKYVWIVKVADNMNRRAVVNAYNVTAETLQEAVEKAQSLEQNMVDQIEEDEGEKYPPSIPVSVELVCELDDQE